MDIKTKYFLGQKFFAMKDNKIVEIEVDTIDIKISSVNEPGKVRQHIEYHFFDLHHAFWGKVEERSCPLNFYDSKEELLEQLKK